MEREFYTNDFENLLKDNADQFKMTPSKKVWHGIYNDLHPGRRWPSVVMSLAFIFSLVIIGHLNTQQSQRSYLTNLQKTLQSHEIAPSQGTSNRDGNDGLENKISQGTGITQAGKTDQKQTEVVAKNIIPFANSESTGIEKIYETGIISTGDYIKNLTIRNKIADLKNVTELISAETSAKVIASVGVINANSGATSVINDELTASDKPEKNNETNLQQTRIFNAATGMTPNHVPVLKIRKNSKVSWTYYLSPSISYRTYSKQDANSGQMLNSDVMQHPSIGVEAGTVMKYSLTRKLKFLAGFQANYSTYSVQANNIHPVMATLLLNNEGRLYTTSAISFYGNGPGSAPVTLHNYSFQLSLPVGFEYKIAGNDDIQLNASASFQPSFVVANRAYILSTDKKNYITQASLSHRWNMSSNFGTFISFKSNKFNWQIGPQVHYQLFSSYSSAYPLREHFVDYGIRFGVSKISR
ncbi:MAG: hypothetical protein ABIO81_02090 [Ginsengibacter sp.]